MYQRQRSPKDYGPEAVAYVRFPSLGKSVEGTERLSEALQTALRPLHRLGGEPGGEPPPTVTGLSRGSTAPQNG